MESAPQTVEYSPSLPTLDSHFAQAAPEMLYHYTSSEALFGIVTKAEMWCTDYRFLNDSTEILYSLNIAKELINERLRKALDDEESIGVVSFLRFSLEIFDAHTVKGYSPRSFYLASFTELPDSLSQWRAYSPPSGGYCIGFESAQMKEISESKKFVFAKCIYDNGMQHAIIAEIIESAVQHCKKSYSDFEFDINFDRAKYPYHLLFIIMFIHNLHKVAPIMKHSSFQEEQEWRLIITSNTNYNKISEEYAYRPSGKGLIPFYKFKIIDNKYPDLAVGLNFFHPEKSRKLTVKVGPAIDAELRNAVASEFLMQNLGTLSDGSYDPGGFKVDNSDIPYKNW